MTKPPHQHDREIGNIAGDAVDAEDGERHGIGEIELVEIGAEEGQQRGDEDPFPEGEDFVQVTPVEHEPVAGVARHDRVARHEAHGCGKHAGDHQTPDRWAEIGQKDDERRAGQIHAQIETVQPPDLEVALQKEERGRGEAESSSVRAPSWMAPAEMP